MLQVAEKEQELEAANSKVHPLQLDHCWFLLDYSDEFQPAAWLSISEAALPVLPEPLQSSDQMSFQITDKRCDSTDGCCYCFSKSTLKWRPASQTYSLFSMLLPPGSSCSRTTTLALCSC